MSNMYNSTSDLLVTTYLDPSPTCPPDSRSPSGRLPVGRIQIRVRTTPPHAPVQTSGVDLGPHVDIGPHVDLSLICSSLRHMLFQLAAGSILFLTGPTCPCQAPRTRAGDVAPRDVLLELK